MVVRDSRNDVYVTALVIDENTMRYGGSFFRRERTCNVEWNSDVFAFVCSECDHMSMMPPGSNPNYCPCCGAKVVE